MEISWYREGVEMRITSREYAQSPGQSDTHVRRSVDTQARSRWINRSVARKSQQIIRRPR